MSERVRFVVLCILLIASIALLWFANHAAGQVLFGSR